MKLFKRGLSIGLVSLLVGCTVLSDTIGPRPPPEFDPGNFNLVSPRSGVIEYQEELLNYISYLEHYYISIGIYYGGKTEFNPKEKKLSRTGETRFRCYVMSQIFKDIDLPPPPKTKNKEVEETLNVLVDHIVDLRKRIRANNDYMESLRKRYKDCK